MIIVQTPLRIAAAAVNQSAVVVAAADDLGTVGLHRRAARLFAERNRLRDVEVSIRLPREPFQSVGVNTVITQPVGNRHGLGQRGDPIVVASTAECPAKLRQQRRALRRMPVDVDDRERAIELGERIVEAALDGVEPRHSREGTDRFAGAAGEQ